MDAKERLAFRKKPIRLIMCGARTLEGRRCPLFRATQAHEATRLDKAG